MSYAHVTGKKEKKLLKLNLNRMETTIKSEAAIELVNLFNLPSDYENSTLNLLSKTDSKYLRDLKMNVRSVLKSEHINEKETHLLALAASSNEGNKALVKFFAEKSKELGATDEEISEAIACASLLSSNNVLYRFRHFTGKEKYQQLPARLRMNIMMNPVNGKEFFELISLAISAINGCEMCVNAHEHSLIDLGTSEERIFDAIKLSAVIVSCSKIVY